MSPFLCAGNGIILAILSDCGTWPELNDKLNIYDRGSIISVDINFNSLGAMFLGPGALLSLKLEIILGISAAIITTTVIMYSVYLDIRS